MASRGSSAWRSQNWGPACPKNLTSISFGRAKVTVNTLAVEAFTALATAMAAHGYDIHPGYPKGDTGAYNCRHQRNDRSLPMSSHSWGTAVDVNWNTNPAGKRLITDMPKAMVADILRIKTKGKKQVFRWGGDWDSDGKSSDHSYVDAMHYELIVTPAELAAGIDWATVPGTPVEVSIVKKMVYTKRGSVDGNVARSVEEAAPQAGLVLTSDKQTAKDALVAGIPVIAVGGPAYRDLYTKKDRSTKAGTHVHDNLTALVGQKALDSAELLLAFARKGWK